MENLKQQLIEFVNTVETSISTEEKVDALVKLVWSLTEHLISLEKEKG